jgi:hypothetical protein
VRRPDEALHRLVVEIVDRRSAAQGPKGRWLPGRSCRGVPDIGGRLRVLFNEAVELDLVVAPRAVRCEWSVVNVSGVRILLFVIVIRWSIVMIPPLLISTSLVIIG